MIRCIQFYIVNMNKALHLQRMIEATDVENRRSRTVDGTTALKVKSFKYYVLLPETNVYVCRKAFLRLCGMIDKRIKHILKHVWRESRLIVSTESIHVQKR